MLTSLHIRFHKLGTLNPARDSHLDHGPGFNWTFTWQLSLNQCGGLQGHGLAEARPPSHSLEVSNMFLSKMYCILHYPSVL